MTLKKFFQTMKSCIDEIFADKMTTHYITGVSKVVYLKDGAAHRDGDKPAKILFDRRTKKILQEHYFKNGVLRRADGKPAIIIHNNDGSVEYYLNRAEYVYSRPCWKAFLASQRNG